MFKENGEKKLAEWTLDTTTGEVTPDNQLGFILTH
jgi:hypothetical protein